MLTTPLCRTLGITAPIFSVGMGALAGACGVLGRVSGAPTAHLRQQIRQVRELTDKRFGVNIILATLQAEWIDICLEEQVPLLVFCWGAPDPTSRTRTAVASRYCSKSGRSRRPRPRHRPALTGSSPRGCKPAGM
jgi:NAD(P)H-dependent flavin oxidoreductase YrpB (nitropropane dioxygenase family)